MKDMSLLADIGLKMERTEMKMIRWMCGVSLEDRRTSEEVRKLEGVEPIRTRRLKCWTCDVET